ncbi:DcaP family trimeric outer membrane transporter [Kushneria aurantia]|uniref:DcaP family trimeric outer membrane transporter n=1 Tax=Kushneria aurantia TaxID=504092 RepID=A0ABV6G0P5_9GAMM|nr:DcaP family trimeric outer membrane transporter [Kushneria aurantia]
MTINVKTTSRSSGYASKIMLPLACLGLSTAAQALELDVGDSEVSIYGFAQLDAAYTDGPDMYAASGFTPFFDIRPRDVEGSDGDFDMGAYTSRIGLLSATPTKNGPIRVVIEGDFHENGGPGFRLRHAYGEWNGILAGQTWTNFSGFVGLTKTIDFTGPVGRPNPGRLAQIRYTLNGFSAALEDPDGFSVGEGILSGTSGVNQSRVPNFTLRYTQSVDAFTYEFGGLGREVGYEVSNEDDYAFGWGINASASYRFGTGIKLRGAVAHGDGIGGYLFFNPGGAGYVKADGKVETIKATSATTGISIPAGTGAFNLSYAMVQADMDDTAELNPAPPNIYGYDRYDSVFLNYIWSPIEPISYGIEVGHHRAEQPSGESNDITRLQGMVRYTF